MQHLSGVAGLLRLRNIPIAGVDLRSHALHGGLLLSDGLLELRNLLSKPQAFGSNNSTLVDNNVECSDHLRAESFSRTSWKRFFIRSR